MLDRIGAQSGPAPAAALVWFIPGAWSAGGFVFAILFGLMQRRLQDEPVTLEDLSTRYDVSRERIRQIEVRAFEKLQKRMRELATKRGLTVDA